MRNGDGSSRFFTLVAAMAFVAACTTVKPQADLRGRRLRLFESAARQIPNHALVPNCGYPLRRTFRM